MQNTKNKEKLYDGIKSINSARYSEKEQGSILDQALSDLNDPKFEFSVFDEILISQKEIDAIKNKIKK